MTQENVPPPIFSSEMEAHRYLLNNLFNRHRANYYPAMARLVINQALARRNLTNEAVVDIGCGIGMSTMEILERTGASEIFAVDPSEAMLRICRTGFLGERGVTLHQCRAEEIANLFRDVSVSAIFCIQMIHLLHKSEAESTVPAAIRAFSEAFEPDGGVLAMDFGPSNGDFRTLKLADPRVGPQSDSEVMTELAHPLYRSVMNELAAEAARRRVGIESFWPPPAARFTRRFLEDTLTANRFEDIRVVEGLYPMRGEDVWNHICLNLWTVAKRWLPKSGLAMDDFFAMLEAAIKNVSNNDEFYSALEISAFHPYQILTAVRQ